jgi:hypothetical protein
LLDTVFSTEEELSRNREGIKQVQRRNRMVSKEDRTCKQGSRKGAVPERTGATGEIIDPKREK